MRANTKRIIVTSLAAMMACTGVFADDDPYTQAPFYIGISGIYSNIANALPNSNRDKSPYGFGVTFGQKSTLFNNPNWFSGFEFQLNHLGSDSWASGKSAQYNQLNALYVLHWFVIPRVDLQAKAGVAWQINQQSNMGSNVNWLALPVVGLSADVYVASRVAIGVSWQYTFGSGDGEALKDNHASAANSNYMFNLSYHF